MNNETLLTLEYKGCDFWDRPVYEDQHKRLWKDVECGNCDTPSLCSVSGNDFEGEPNSPIKQEYIITIPYVKNRKRFEYMMLSRLEGDCKTHLNRINGITPYAHKLSKEQQAATIKEMKQIYNSFTEDEKPEWLTYEQILEYERLMSEEPTA